MCVGPCLQCYVHLSSVALIEGTTFDNVIMRLHRFDMFFLRMLDRELGLW